MTATKTLRGMFITGHGTLGNDPCNLCYNGATKLRDKLQEKLPCVTAPVREECQITTRQTDVIFLENERCSSDGDKFLELYLQETEKYIIVRSGEGNFGEIKQFLWNLS